MPSVRLHRGNNTPSSDSISNRTSSGAGCAPTTWPKNPSQALRRKFARKLRNRQPLSLFVRLVIPVLLQIHKRHRTAPSVPRMRDLSISVEPLHRIEDGASSATTPQYDLWCPSRAVRRVSLVKRCGMGSKKLGAEIDAYEGIVGRGHILIPLPFCRTRMEITDLPVQE